MRSRTGPKASLIYMHKPVVYSKAAPAACSVCGQTPEAGFRVTARVVPEVGTRLFCEYHCPE